MKRKIALILIFGLGLATLVSCPQPQAPENNLKTVSGTVVEDDTPEDSFKVVTKPWTGGAGNVMGSYVAASAPSAVKLGNVAVDGTFSATVPSTVDAALLSEFSSEVNEGCTGNLNVSDKKVRGVNMTLAVDANKDGQIQPLLLSGMVDEKAEKANFKFELGGLMYVDRPVNVTGSQVCLFPFIGLDENIPTTVNMKLKKGWNYVAFTFSLAADKEGTTSAGTITSGKLPTDKWLFASDTATPLSVTYSKLIPEGVQLKALNQMFR